IASGAFSLCVFFAITWFITRIGRRESEDEYISGMQLTDKPAEVNRLLRQNGELSDLRVGDLHMVKRAEVMNFLIHGTIGVGKSTLIRWLLDYIRRRGDRAIIYDSGCTFTETHYNPQTDFILNAHDERCANWQMWGECIDTVDYENLAASLIPVEGDSDPFWVSSSRTIFSDLAIRMSADPERSIEKFLMTLLSLSMKSLREYLANTPSANLVEEKIEKTAISIRSVVTNYAKALRYLQGLDDGTKPPFTIREWMTSGRYDNSWLFISTQARHRKSVRPLISMWLSMTTLLLQSMGENSERRVWFIIDEKTSLQRIPEFAETLAEARKFGGCFVIGIQNMAQLIHVYGREMARSIFDLLNTRMYGRSPSAEMAKVVEEDLGNQRRKEAREQNSYGLDQVRDGISIGKDKVNQPVVDYEQIMRLPNLNFYVRLPGEYPVVRLGLK
ncbi:type IV conjugative transfer system coupling protein TraD, partial [Cronobacter sakazakii]